VPQGSVSDSVLFVVYINDIWRNIDSCIRIFADNCIIYRKITNKDDIEELQKDLDTLGEWLVENEMKINPAKSKAIRFTRAWVQTPLGYSLGDQNIPEARSCKYVLGNNLTKRFKLGEPSKLHRAKSLEGTSFCNVVLKKGNRNTKSLSYTSLVRPILEYGVAYWNACTEGQINALDRVQKKAVQYTNHTKVSD